MNLPSIQKKLQIHERTWKWLLIHKTKTNSWNLGTSANHDANIRHQRWIPPGKAKLLQNTRYYQCQHPLYLLHHIHGIFIAKYSSEQESTNLHVSTSLVWKYTLLWSVQLYSTTDLLLSLYLTKSAWAATCKAVWKWLVLI